MEVEKHEFIHVRMHMLEAEKVKMLLDSVVSSDMPTWAKDLASKIAKDLEKNGVE